jgi:hypothetical protein
MGTENIVRSANLFFEGTAPAYVLPEEHAEAGMLVFHISHIWNVDSSDRWTQHLGWNLSTRHMPLIAMARAVPVPPPEPEPQAAGVAAENYDISALLEAANDNDAQQLRAWKCGICFDGLDAGSELTAAHQVKDEETGQVVGVHVFHRQCLLDWQASNERATCPTCRHTLQPRPLPAVWSAGMTVNAHMGANLYSVQWV